MSTEDDAHDARMAMQLIDDDWHAAIKLIEQIGPLFEPHPMRVVGAVLANLAATWLSCHQVFHGAGKDEKRCSGCTASLRRSLLEFHCDRIFEGANEDLEGGEPRKLDA